MSGVTVPGDDDGRLGRGRVVAGWALAVVGAALLTVVLVPFRSAASPSYEAMLYLGLAVTCALVGGLWPAAGASLLGTVLLNYWFTPPLHTLEIAKRGNVLTLLFFLVVSVAVASVVDSAARRRHQAMLARGEANTLAMLNRTVLGGEYDVPRLLDLVRETFAAESAELVGVDDSGRVARGDTTAPATGDTLLVLHGRVLDGAGRRVLNAFATHVGVLREREELARQTRAARELEAGNRTRTALLAAVSHDLRTPLAGIQAAAETLRTISLDEPDRAELLATIEDWTTRLTTIVTDLLDMSRLQTGAVTPVLTRVSPEGVLLEVTRTLDGAERVKVDRLPDVLADEGLLARVLENLLSNAVRHADAVEVTAETLGLRVRLQVVDHGPGVPVDQRVRMFEPFQRLGDSPQGSGVGLGLAVARGLTEAQGGSLDALDTPGGGLTMVIELPAGAS